MLSVMSSVRRTFYRGILLSTLVCIDAWAGSVIQKVSPDNLPPGQAAEISIKVKGGSNHQFALMPAGPYLKQNLPLPHLIHDMVAHRGHGLLAAGERGLLVARVDTSGQMNISAAHATNGSVTRVVVENDHAWLVNDETEIVMLDMADPEKPAELGRYRASKAIADITAHGDFVYLLMGKATIAVIDMRVPQTPVELDRFTLDDETQKIFVSRDHIYAAQPGYGLAIIDAADKSHLEQIGRHAVSGGATAVTVQDETSLMASGESGVTLLDVSDPAHIKWLGSHSRLGRVAGMSSNFKKTLLWNDRSELIALDTANPELPAIASSYRNNGTDSSILTNAGWLKAIWLDESTVLAANSSGLQSIDFSATPPLFSNENLDTGQGVNFGGERRLYIEGDIAYVADWFSGLHLYDISTPSRPRLLSSFHTPGSAKGVVVRDGHAFVADDDHGLQVVDVRDPLHPAHIGSLATNGLAYTPKLAGNLLYLAGHRGGFQIIDVSDVTVPKLLADMATPGKAWSLEIAGNTLYVADDTAGVLVFDVSDAKHPKQIGAFNPGGSAEDVVVRGNTAYAAFFDRGLYVLDISHPDQPRQLGHTPTSGNARGIALKNDLAYVADWFAGIQVVDVSDKKAPRIVGAYDTSGAAWGIAIKGEHAYIGDWWGGFDVLDISDPGKPVLADRFQAKGKVMQIAALGNFAFAAMQRGGVQIFDITNTPNPTWITSVDVEGDITGMVLEGTVIYVAVGSGKDSGLVLIDVSNYYQARRLRHLAVEGGVQRIRSGMGRLYFSGDYGLGVIDPSDPDRARTWSNQAAKINDLWIEGKRIFLATGQGMEVLDDQLNLKLRYKSSHAASMVRAHGSTAFLYGEVMGLRVLDVSGFRARHVSSFATAETLLDMAVDGDKLYATGSSGELLEMDSAGKGGLGVRWIYPLARPATGIRIINGVALLAGNDIITSVKLLPPVAVTHHGKNEIRMMLSKDMPAGTYHAVDIAPNGNRGISYNILHIDMPGFAKPDISPEEFQKLLQEQRQGNLHSAPVR